MESAKEIFKPNDHSRYEPKWIAATPEQEAQVKTATSLLHPGSTVDSVRKSGQLEFHSNNYTVILSDGVAAQRKVALKEHKSLRELRSIEIVRDLLRHLFDHNVPVVPPSGTVEKIGENYWESYHFVEGNHFRGSGEELSGMGRAVARLHKGLSTYPNEKLLEKEQELRSWSRKGFEHVYTLAEGDAGPWGTNLRENKDFIFSAISEVEAGQDAFAKAPRQGIHNDLHPHNVIMEDGAVVSFFSLSKATVGPRVQDIGMALHRAVRQYAVAEKKERNRSWTETVPKGVAIFLDAYQSENPLSPEEIALIPVAAKNLQLEKLYTRGIDTRPRKPGDSRAIEKWLELVRELAVIGDAVRAYQSANRPE